MFHTIYLHIERACSSFVPCFTLFAGSFAGTLRLSTRQSSSWSRPNWTPLQVRSTSISLLPNTFTSAPSCKKFLLTVFYYVIHLVLISVLFCCLLLIVDLDAEKEKLRPWRPTEEIVGDVSTYCHIYTGTYFYFHGYCPVYLNDAVHKHFSLAYLCALVDFTVLAYQGPIIQASGVQLRPGVPRAAGIRGR